MQLFVLSPDSGPDGPRLQVGESAWALMQQELKSGKNDIGFTCISYSWGLGRTPSVFHPSFQVSDRTEPAISAVILQRPECRRIWVDAFCVPGPRQPVERAATLESMGFIYSQADEVIVVLTAQTRPVLEQITKKLELLRPHLDILEQEDWVTRAWTYQETVNAKRLRITCHDAPVGTIIDVFEFISSLGQALNNMNSKDRTSYPRLNSFEDVMLDCATAGYLERSSLQVMSMMDERTQTFPDDHFYAMIGAISTEPARPVNLLSPCEAFMSLCERKGDYSFIFSSNPRDPRPGRRWRPQGGPDLPAILRFPSTGSGLRGRVEQDCLFLENVVAMKPGPASPDARASIAHWLATFEWEGCDANLSLEELAFRTLQDFGFSGSPVCLETDFGLFFPQVQLPLSAQIGILVAVGIQWRLGSPALARYQESLNNETVFYVPGVFLGKSAEAAGASATVILV